MNAYFAGARCQNAVFERAMMSYANFEEADLTGVDFSGNVIDGVSFIRANLSGARMSWSSYEDPKLNGAVFDRTTTWPEGFSPVIHGAVLRPEDT